MQNLAVEWEIRTGKKCNLRCSSDGHHLVGGYLFHSLRIYVPRQVRILLLLANLKLFLERKPSYIGIK
jgi:hypothetical protein